MASQFPLGRTLAGAIAASALAVVAAACGDSFQSPLSPVTNTGQSASSVRAADRAAHSNPGDLNEQLAKVRAVNSKYHNIEAAFADGYVDDGYGCIDATFFGLDKSLGGMGFHLINWALHDDPATDPLRPDLLVYEPARTPNSKPKLVAVEWEVFTSDWRNAGNTQPPSLFGREFELLEGADFSVYGLHAWLWLDNPSGMFFDWNPRTRCD